MLAAAMALGLISYAIALVGFGVASGVEIRASRAGYSLGGVAYAVATLSGLIDIALYIWAFAMLTDDEIAVLFAVGIAGTAGLATMLPRAPAWVVFPALAGAGGLAAYAVG